MFRVGAALLVVSFVLGGRATAGEETPEQRIEALKRAIENSDDPKSKEMYGKALLSLEAQLQQKRDANKERLVLGDSEGRSRPLAANAGSRAMGAPGYGGGITPFIGPGWSTDGLLNAFTGSFGRNTPNIWVGQTGSFRIGQLKVRPGAGVLALPFGEFNRAGFRMGNFGIPFRFGR